MLITPEIYSSYYQIEHPWHWLVYGQNAAAIGAMASLLAAAAASTAGYFAYRAYRTTVEQLEIGRKQYWDAHKIYLETVRPHLIVRLRGYRPTEVTVAASVFVNVKNVGSGRAINIEGKNGIAFNAFSLAAGSESEATVELITHQGFGTGFRTFLLYYSSVDGRRFRAETTIRDWVNILNEEELDISAGIEPETFEELTANRRSEQIEQDTRGNK